MSDHLHPAGFCAIMLILLAYPARADISMQDVRIYTANDPPYVVVDKQGQLIGGTTVDKMLQVLEELQLSPDIIQSVPWSRALKEARNNPGVMIFPMAKTVERLKYFDFTFKIIDSYVYFYKLKHREDIQLNQLEDARKYSICVVSNDYRQEYLEAEGFTRLDFATDSTLNVKKFIHGRCDLIISTEIGLASKLKSLDQDGTIVKRLLLLDKLDSALYAAFNKTTPPEIIELFRRAAREK
ncbi:transporter substrate-binding domain-containing protein [Chitinivorax sp. B]|uniref:substrate-binding periplasmic protein n=1 Tax=Chitinivorax sp. B TaxID=2502235 RepID=UPI0010F852A9|nr:transporter substrate-binding domain-containing protein [Chitinivorax sp. B]